MKSALIGITVFALSGCLANPLGRGQVSGDFSPGIDFSLSQTSVQVYSAQVVSGQTTQIIVTLADQYGSYYIGAGAMDVQVALDTSDPVASQGTLDAVLNIGEGVYSVTFTAFKTGDPAQVLAWVNGQPVQSALPTIQVTAGQLSQLAFVQSPTSVTANQTIAPAIIVAGEDYNGNVIPDFNLTVQLALVGGATINGTLGQAAVNGIATFDDITIGSAGTYRLQAIQSDQLLEIESPAFVVN